jgi:Ca2+-binding RTX toxin-like protein
MDVPGTINLYGGGGNDTFVMSITVTVVDRIFGFEAGAGAGDVLDISAISASRI